MIFMAVVRWPPMGSTGHDGPVDEHVDDTRQTIEKMSSFV
jgi:hypothetical protein